MQGCTGGTFLSQEVSSLHHWIDFEGPYMLVDFNRAPINSAYPLPHWSVRYEFHLSRDELTKSEWWNWNDFLPPPNVTRPPWWSVTNMEDAKVCVLVSALVLHAHYSLSQLFMPTIVVSKTFIDKVMESVADAQVFCENNRDVVERIYGPPPGREGGFQSFTRTQIPYDCK